MVSRLIVHRIRTRHFQVKKERIETGVFVKTQEKVRMSTLEGNQVNSISGSKRAVFKRRCCCFPPRIRSNCVAYSKIQSRRNPSRFYGRAPNPWDLSAACTTRKVPYSTQVGKERVHRREFFRSVNVTSVALKLYNLGTDPRKKPCNKNDAPAEMHGKWRNMFAISKKKDKVTLFSPSEVWSLPASSSTHP